MNPTKSPKMKIHKSIFRIDFPVSFGLLDSFGAYSQLIHGLTQKKPFEAAQSAINLQAHAVSNQGKVCDSGSYVFNLSIANLDGTIEHAEGIELDQLAKHPIFELTDVVVGKLQHDLSTPFERIGLRSWVLLEDASFAFAKIRDRLRERAKLVDDVVSKSFGVPSDIALVFEATNEYEVRMRLACGPYQKSEHAKYFSADPGIAEAFILDIDLYETKVELPGFRMTKFAARCQRTLSQISSSMSQQLRGVHRE